MIESSLVDDESDPQEYVQRVIDRWRQFGNPDAAKAVADRPDIRDDEQLVLDLVYEEYCLRREEGEELAASTFFEQFPTLQDSIVDMIEVHDEIGDDAELMEELGPAPVEISWPSVGDSFRGYQITDRLGHGSLARVYLATNPELGSRYVALKVSRDLQEAATTGRLDHPNIMDVLWVEHDRHRNATWMCMPYCGSATLRDVVDLAHRKGTPIYASVIVEAAVQRSDVQKASEKRPPDSIIELGSYVEGALYLGVQLADALQHAHSRGILHRDLKANNVLLTTAGAPKLLDFNLSSDNHVDTKRAGGTLGYMAPEQIESLFRQSDSAHVDCRSEVYGLGVILYELLTGKLPFGKPDLKNKPVSECAEEMLARQLSQQPESPRQHCPELSSKAESILFRCLHADPNKRFQSAAELRDAIQQQQQILTKKRTNIALRERRVVAGLGIAAFILVLFGLVMARADAIQSSPGKMRETAMRNYRNSDFQSASRVFDKMPTGAMTEQDQATQAFCMLVTGNVEPAIRRYELLHQKHKDNAQYANNLAVAYRSVDPEFAYALILGASEENPNDSRIMRNRARIPYFIYCSSGKTAGSPNKLLEYAEAALSHGELKILHVSAALYAALAGMSDETFDHAARARKLGAHQSCFMEEAFLAVLLPEQLNELKSMEGVSGPRSFQDFLIAP